MSSQPANRGLAAARKGRAGEPGDLAQPPEQGDVATGRSEREITDEERPGPAALGPDAGLDQPLEGGGRLERRGREQVSLELGAGQVDELDREIGTGLEASDQQVGGAPERLERLELGVMEDLAEDLAIIASAPATSSAWRGSSRRACGAVI